MAEDGRAEAPRAEGRRPLDLLNLFLADVRDGLGPYLAIWLVSTQGWDQAGTGAVLAIGGIAGLLAKAPAGVLADAVPSKRLLLAIATVAITLACGIVLLSASFPAVALSQVLSGAAAALVAPALSSLTLGLSGPRRFAAWTGRNESWNHGGNALAASAAGGLSFLLGPVAVFWLMGALALATLLAVRTVPPGDPALARGLAPGEGSSAGWRDLLSSRPLLVLAVCVGLFHFANAPMLPLVGQKLAQGAPDSATALVSACVVAAQGVMIGTAWFAGRYAERWGRKPVFLLGFGVLALRGLLYPLSDAPGWLVAVQLLDGVGAGFFGVLLPLMAADLSRGTGHFGAAIGLLAAAQDIGASGAQAAAGWLAASRGYDAAFLALAGVAVAGTAAMALFLPETRGGVAGRTRAVPVSA